MNASTRWFAATALVALLGSVALHFMTLVGAAWLWPAATHLTIFGWVTAMILVVSYHTMPVFSARDFPYPRLIALHYLLFAAGIALTTIGLAFVEVPVTIAGLQLEASASLVFIANIILLFRCGPKRTHGHPVTPIPSQRDIDRLGTRATKVASVCLPLSLLGLAAVYQGILDVGWLLASEHLATLGWVMLMIVGVAVHVLPRFSGHGLRGPGWVRAQQVCHCIALGLMVFALGFDRPAVLAIGAMLMAVALGLFAATVWPALALTRSPSSNPIMLQKRPQ